MPKTIDHNAWEEQYAEAHQMPLTSVSQVCRRMRGEKTPIASFGTAANWAYRRKVRLDARTTPLAEAYFDLLTAQPEEPLEAED